ncbi:uncharacterized protein LOC119308803 isoform X2 [Triticum dicoccoides]|uniref:uncharacterized protein LOC119308803 isoform X2 n=1 Tax=Triticum dicoccoides TaxID=85692 RepID=UPI0018910CD1|nr:uncharacterized protein LOC119308803 isoform X2 [Triticum dicoccoides]XP_044388452.1 uncharacterized protein LOC123111677 isoform X2 [Triticum aestivum]XP_044388453.1 uncharacterized protein LOC123111677 isoform X2 [Triticum aestivum]
MEGPATTSYNRIFDTTGGIFCCDRQIKDEEQHELYGGCCSRRRAALRAAGSLAGDAPRRPCWSWASPEMRRGGLAGAARCCEPWGSRRRCVVLRAAVDLAGDAPRDPRKKKLGIIRNRSTALRGKQCKMPYLSDLESNVELLQQETNSLPTRVQSMEVI